MSPRLRRLSAPEVIQILERHGFQVHSQRGSHVKLRRVGARGQKETLTIPAHADLDAGTLRAIFRQATRYMPEEDLYPHFYSD